MTREAVSERLRLQARVADIAGDYDKGLAVIRLAVEACCAKLLPKNPRPCDCDICDCRNSGDLAAVTAWDRQQADVDLLRQSFLPTPTKEKPDA